MPLRKKINDVCSSDKKVVYDWSYLMKVNTHVHPLHVELGPMRLKVNFPLSRTCEITHSLNK